MLRSHSIKGGSMVRVLLAVLLVAVFVVCTVMTCTVTSVRAAQTAPAGSDMTIPTLAGGYSFSLLVCSDGTLWSMGRNQNGQLGLGDYANRWTPTPVGSAANWKAVDAQYFHSVGVRSDGALWGWGQNGDGQLGLGYISSEVIVPTRVGSAINWIAVSTGQSHSLGLRSDGTLWAWGNNEYGQLGQGDNVTRLTPTQVGSATNWMAVSGRWNHSLALRSDGTLWAWGYNGSGELGLGDKYTRYSPTPVGIDKDWVSIATDFSYSLGIRSDGTLWSWGFNYKGILGLGDEIDRLIPTQVGSATNWVAVGPGRVHCLGLRSDGTLWAWGSNYEGELGTGDTSVRLSPTRVGSATNWLAVAAGDAHSVGWRTDGTLWGWGRNWYGELGLGGYIDKVLVPTQVSLSTELPLSVTTLPASDISPTTATLNGNLTSLGSASSADVSFEWGLTTGYGNSTASQSMVGTGAFSRSIGSLSPGRTYHFRAKAAGDSTVYGSDMTFTTTAFPTPPAVTTAEASNVGLNSAQLNANLTSLGTSSSVGVSFELGTAPGVYLDQTMAQVRTSTGAFQSNLTGLASGTTYYYRAKAEGAVPSYGVEKSFTTGTMLPSVMTDDASNITSSSATLNGDLTSMASAPSVSVSFQWGTSSGVYSYETTPETKSSSGVFHFDLHDLSGGRAFYYRAKVSGDGTVYGLERSLTTSTAPTVTTSDPSSITTNSARLNGNLASLGSASNITVSFVWGTGAASYPYETRVQTAASTGPFYFDLGGLTPGITYYYKAKVVGDGEAFYGPGKSFTIGQIPVVDSTYPESAKRGQVLTVNISGVGFDGAVAVRFGAGITVRSFNIIGNTEITAEIAIDPDAGMGPRDVSLTTRWGTGTKADGFSVAGGEGGVCGSTDPITPRAASEMITTMAALGILFGAGYWLLRWARKGNAPA